MNKRYQYTPDPSVGEDEIVLEPNEVFVFGANKLGAHGGGAARDAAKRFGAVYGEIHRTGRSYGLVTVARPHVKITPQELEEEFALFFKQTELEPEKTFYLTKVGLGLGGWTLHEVLAAFHKHYQPDKHKNVVLPAEEWEPNTTIFESDAIQQ